jgi:hypothetical protein
MQASVVIGKATAILQDVGDVRASAADKLGLLNSAQRMVVMIRPDAKTSRGLITLVDGPHQTIPATGLRLIKLVRNSTGRAVSLISEEQLNDFDPSWYTAARAVAVKHYLFDPLEPKAFDVYPPAAVNTQVLGVWSVLPADLALATDPIALDDIYEMPLVHLLCYGYYLRDSREPNNQALARMHLEAATLMLTGKTNADERTDPATSQPAKVRPNVR